MALPPRVKVPTDLTKFSATDDTRTLEHVSRYLLEIEEAAMDDTCKIRYFPLSLTGPAFTWFSTLPSGSIGTWDELEQMFHSYFFTGSNEKTMADLMALRMKNSETPMEYLHRFREVKNMCYSLSIPDDQLPGMVVAGMLPHFREKLVGIEFEDLGHLAKRLAAMGNQAWEFKRDNRFGKNNSVNEVYESFSEEATEHEEEEEIDAAELNWAKELTQVD